VEAKVVDVDKLLDENPDKLKEKLPDDLKK
jgi:hypothetical protein